MPDITVEDHRELFTSLENVRSSNPNFRYFTRQKDFKNRLSGGYIFRGSESYASAGLVKRGDNKAMVHKVALVQCGDRNVVNLFQKPKQFYVEFYNHDGDEHGYNFSMTVKETLKYVVEANPKIFQFDDVWDKPEGMDCRFRVAINCDKADDAVRHTVEKIFPLILTTLQKLGMEENWLGTMDDCRRIINNALQKISARGCAEVREIYPESVV